MKFNYFLLSCALAFSILFTLASCNKCDNEDPRARIINNSNEKASVQIQTSGGNTVNINNIDPGQASAYDSYAPGTVTFTIKIKNVDYAKTVEVKKCVDYDISIDNSYIITITAIDRN
jgi:hypothetical protein